MNLACTKAMPTASRRGHFLSLNSDHFNSSGNVVDVNDRMWYTMVWLYACNGGTPGEFGVSAAESISERINGMDVYASAYAKVNYTTNTLRPYAVPDFGRMNSIFDFFKSGWRFISNK